DVVGDDRHVERVAEPAAEHFGERGLSRADGPADAHLERARNPARGAHERNNRASSVAWRIAASSSPGLNDHIASGAVVVAGAATRAMRGRIAASTRGPSSCPSESSRNPAPTSSAAVVYRYAPAASSGWTSARPSAAPNAIG